MKYFLIALLLVIKISASAQSLKVSGIELKKGLNLVYDVTRESDKYQYIVEFTSVTEKGVEFNWKMTEPINKSGTVKITRSTMDSATYLDFYPETRTYNRLEITMIMGQVVYQKLASAKPSDTVSFGCNSCFRAVTTTNIKKNSCQVKDSTGKLSNINTLKFSSIYKNGEFEVLNNSKFPLIVYFKWNMTIELKSFSYTKQ